MADEHSPERITGDELGAGCFFFAVAGLACFDDMDKVGAMSAACGPIGAVAGIMLCIHLAVLHDRRVDAAVKARRATDKPTES